MTKKAKLVNPIKLVKKKNNYNYLSPVNKLNGDVYLVSYPKSGNTWLRFLVANAIKCKYGIDRDVNFFSINEFIPDIHISRNLRSEGIYGQNNLPRIIKSHASFNPYYSRVILLVRNPIDVMLSYYYFSISNEYITEDVTFSEFIKSRKNGVDSWVAHTQSWLTNYKTGHIIRIFFYENLKQNTQQELEKIINLLGISVDDSILKQALHLSSLDMMRRSETKHISTLQIENQKFPFVRQAGTNFKKELRQEEREFIKNATKSIERQLNTEEIWL